MLYVMFFEHRAGAAEGHRERRTEAVEVHRNRLGTRRHCAHRPLVAERPLDAHQVNVLVYP